MSSTAAQQPLTLTELNALPPTRFIEIFGNCVESWPQAAAHVADRLPVGSVDQLIDHFQAYLDQLGAADKTAILRLHPDLAGRLAAEGKLTPESTLEQRGAGLDRLTANQFEQLQCLNKEYLRCFGYPFVICVRQTNKIEAILGGLRQRLRNEADEELETSVAEVKKICSLRALQLVEH